MNQCQLMGRLTREPELRQTTSGIPVASFSIAVDRRKGKDGTQEADFFNIVAWRHTAEFVSRYFAKGQRVAVVGQIQIRDYQDKDGVQRRATEIVAESVFFADSKREENHGQSYAPPYQPPAPQQSPQYQTPHETQASGASTDYSIPPRSEATQFQTLPLEIDDADLPF